MSDPSEPTTLGAYLRAARRKRRVSLERAAEQTRIRADFLMRMESDDFDFLAPAYVRGFLASYARFLQIPEEPIVEEFDRRYGTGKVDTAQMIAADRKRARKGSRERHFHPLAIALFGVAALLLVFAVIGLTAGPGDENGGNGRIANARRSASPSPTPTPTPSPTPTFTPTPTPTETLIPVTDGIELEIAAARDDCWVQVKSDGQLALEEIIPQGESRFFLAEKDMEVILGFPRGVDLILNGEDLGFAGGTDPLEFSLPDELALIS